MDIAVMSRIAASPDATIQDVYRWGEDAKGFSNHDYWLHALETPELDIGSSSVAISPNSSTDGGPLTQCAFEAASNEPSQYRLSADPNDNY